MGVNNFISLKPEERKVTFPLMGPYTELFEFLAKEMGFQVVLPPKTTQETIKLGVRHSSSMVCFPFKVTLGNLIQGLEAGANTIFAGGITDNPKEKETCRFGFYFHIQEEILRRMGYKFDIIYLRGPATALLKSLKQSNTNMSYYKIIRVLWRFWEKMKEIEKREFTFEKKDINIGLIGEVYTLWENEVNYNIIKKLKSMGVGVDCSITLSWFLKHWVHLADEKKELHKEVREKYFPKRIGGHGYESIVNTLYYAKNGFDGVIHLAPLSCMPETMAEMVVDMVGKDYKIPIYRFPIDENKFEAGFDTRLETFIKLLKREKNVG